MGFVRNIRHVSINVWPATIIYVLTSVISNLIPNRIKRQYEAFRRIENSGFRVKKTGEELVISGSILHDIKVILKAKSSDPLVFDQLFLNQEYQPLMDVIHDAGIVPEHIIDAGANIGCATLLFKLNYPKSNILALEPNLTALERLKKNIEINAITNVITKNIALWSSNIHLSANRTFRDGEDWSFTLQPGQQGVKPFIQGITVNDLLKEIGWSSIDVFKMDIEGGEAEVFRNEESLSAWLPLTRILAIEIHDETNHRPLIVKMLHKYGFAVSDTRDGLTIAVNQNRIT